MRRLWTVALLVLSALAALATAQDRTELFSNPALPTREALDRLNLTQAWFTSFPMDGRRDGFLSTVIDGGQMLVQTRSGVVGAVDLETGRILWRTLPGRPYRTGDGLAVNTFSVYVMSGTDLYALNRRTGQEQWQFRLPGGMSAAPVADDEQLYLCASNTRLYAARVPKYDATGRYVSTEAEVLALGRTIASPETRALVGADRTGPRFDPTLPNLYQSGSPPAGPRPTLVWEVQTNQQLEWRPVLSKDSVVVSGNDPNLRTGRLMGFTKYPRGETPTEIFRFPLGGPLVAAPGGYENVVYAGAADANLYAINMDTGRVDWRFIVGDIVSARPVATAKDVFVSTQRNGLARLDRETGSPMWRVPAGAQSLEYNNEADRFLASNPKYVYAFDRAGRLLVLDRLQGKTLSRFETTDFVYPIVNDQTDRVFLAANNGMIVCLHDKEYVQPVPHRTTLTDIQQLAAKLAKPVTQGPVANVPIRTFLREFEKAHELKIIVNDRAFQELGRTESLNKTVSLPAITGRPVGEILNQALAQIEATTIVVRDTILVAPAGPGGPRP